MLASGRTVLGLLVVYESVYAATASVRAAAITTVTLGALIVGWGRAAHVRRRRVEPAVPTAVDIAPDHDRRLPITVPPHPRGHPAGPAWPSRRTRWPFRVFATVCAIVAFTLIVGGLTDGTLSSQARAGYVAGGILFTLLTVDTATGRLAADLRRYRAVTRANPRARAPLAATLTIGTMLVLFGLAGFLAINGLRTHGARAVALVTNVTRSRSRTYFLRYETESGRVVTCSTEDVHGSLQPGDRIEVVYDTTDPSTNCQDARLGTGFVEPAVFTTIGVAVLAAWRMLYVWARRAASTAIG